MLEAVAQVVHRARPRRLRAGLAEPDAERGLGELDGHRNGAVAPDPEQRAWPPGNDAHGDSRDVARADGGRQGRHERLEWCECARGSA